MRVGGTAKLRVNGVPFLVKGAIDWNLGRPKKEDVLGQDKPHGFKEVQQFAMIKCTVTVTVDTDVVLLTTGEGLTVTAEIPDGRVVMLEAAWQSGEGTVNTEEGELEVEFKSAEPGVIF
jgi:hypothetical protein